MASMTLDERERFLAEARYGVLTTLSASGAPISVPVWFDWDGESVRMFSNVAAPKMRRLRSNPSASLLVVNHVGEKEGWVAFDGVVSVHESGGLELAEKLAPRYWDVSEPANQQVLEFWRKTPEVLQVLQLEPKRVRTYKV